MIKYYEIVLTKRRASSCGQTSRTSNAHYRLKGFVEWFCKTDTRVREKDIRIIRVMVKYFNTYKTTNK